MKEYSVAQLPLSLLKRHHAHPAAPRRFRWRRLLQYRLRRLLILTTVCAALFAWWSHKARQQRAAVVALRTLGATSENSLQDCPLLDPKAVVDTFAVRVPVEPAPGATCIFLLDLCKELIGPTIRGLCRIAES